MERLRGFGRYQKARLKCDGLNRHPTLQFVNALSYLPTRYSRHRHLLLSSHHSQAMTNWLSPFPYPVTSTFPFGTMQVLSRLYHTNLYIGSSFNYLP